MRTFIKLKNGNIVLMTRRMQAHGVGHGINLNSPSLKQVNFRLANIDENWEFDYWELIPILKRLDTGTTCKTHSCRVANNRYRKIFELMATLRPGEKLPTVQN